jgi:molecular chaperone DnaK (HSP70)
LSEDQVEAMIRESVEKAEQDMRERQVREARVEADNILSATGKAKRNDAWSGLSNKERAAVEGAERDLLSVYNSDDHLQINEKIEHLNKVTHKLAENMMNTAVRGALKGTKIE